MKIFIATSPFGKCGKKPLELLENTGWNIIHNPKGRRLRPGELEEICPDVDAIIAGTEPYNESTIGKLSNLKVISRVGIGLDSVDLVYCRGKGIKVTYTPEAPSQGVAELAVGNIINLCRFIHISDKSVRELSWNRYIGVLLEEIKIGVIGVGRIGKRVIKLLQPFNPTILACDLEPDIEFSEKYKLQWLDKEQIFKNADLITLHIPMNNKNRNYIDRHTLSIMKTGSYLINTSRGGIVDEEALYDALLQRHLAGAAIDVFNEEPYNGKLIKLDNVVLTAHMGASANKSRYLMELGAVEDCIRVLNGENPKYDAIKDSEQLGEL